MLDLSVAGEGLGAGQQLGICGGLGQDQGWDYRYMKIVESVRISSVNRRRRRPGLAHCRRFDR